MLKLESLNYLYRVYQFNSVKLAAESIPVSPSTVSGAIHKLETEWGIPLLIRTYRGIELTEHAKRIAKSLEKLFLEVNRVENIIAMEQSGLNRIPNEKKGLTLLMSRGWWQGATQRILPYLLDKGVKVNLPDLSYGNEKLLSLVNEEENTILINFFYEPMEKSMLEYPQIAFKKISSGSPGLLVRNDSQWISKDAKYILPENVSKIPILRFTEGYDIVFSILERLEEYGSLNIIENISNVQVLLAMLEADLGVCIACEDNRMKSIENSLRFVPIKMEDRLSLALCYNKNTLESYLILVERMLKELF